MSSIVLSLTLWSIPKLYSCSPLWCSHPFFFKLKTSDYFVFSCLWEIRAEIDPKRKNVEFRCGPHNRVYLSTGIRVYSFGPLGTVYRTVEKKKHRILPTVKNWKRHTNSENPDACYPVTSPSVFLGDFVSSAEFDFRWRIVVKVLFFHYVSPLRVVSSATLAVSHHHRYWSSTGKA